MKNTARIRAHFIYEADNIPDHRSRQFGHCPCLLAVIKDCFPHTKKAVFGLPPEHGKRKINPLLNKSILPSHHNMPAVTKQAGKGQWINHIPYK